MMIHMNSKNNSTDGTKTMTLDGVWSTEEGARKYHRTRSLNIIGNNETNVGGMQQNDSRGVTHASERVNKLRARTACF